MSTKSNLEYLNNQPAPESHAALIERLALAMLGINITGMPHHRIPRLAEPGASSGNCHFNAERYCQRSPGYYVVTGWALYPDGWYLHSAVRGPDGAMFCVTPAHPVATGDDATAVLFAPDYDIIHLAPVGFVHVHARDSALPSFVPIP